MADAGHGGMVTVHRMYEGRRFHPHLPHRPAGTGAQAWSPRARRMWRERRASLRATDSAARLASIRAATSAQ